MKQTACLIGLDIGGTKIAGGLVVFPSGDVLTRRVIPTRPERGGYAVLEDTLDLSCGLMQEAVAMNHEVAGIGAGVAELVNQNGEITSSQTIAWRGLPIQERLSQLAPSLIEADVRAAALGEALYGAAHGYNCFAYVTVGTGISYSLVLEGVPYAGTHGNALILASGATSHTCAYCGKRSTSVLEDYASGPAIARRYSSITGRDTVTGDDVIRAAASGDPTAVEIAESAGAALGAAVGNLVNLLDPGAIVVGGGLGLCGGCYWQSFLDSTRSHIWAEASRDIPVLRAGLGRDSGFIGAAAACWQKYRQPAKEIS